MGKDLDPETERLASQQQADLLCAIGIAIGKAEAGPIPYPDTAKRLRAISAVVQAAQPYFGEVSAEEVVAERKRRWEESRRRGDRPTADGTWSGSQRQE